MSEIKSGQVWQQEVCIGSLGQQKVYLNWSDVKDICTSEVLEAYEQTKRENAQLKELLKDCREYVKKDYGDYLTYTQSTIYQEINQALGEE